MGSFQRMTRNADRRGMGKRSVVEPLTCGILGRSHLPVWFT